MKNQIQHHMNNICIYILTSYITNAKAIKSTKAYINKPSISFGRNRKTAIERHHQIQTVHIPKKHFVL